MAIDIPGYQGKRVVVMGCFSGTGEACARALVGLGAEVHGADIKPSPVNLASFTEVDLKSADSIAAGIASIGGKVDALFNVSGLPQTFPGEDVVTVNFLGIRAWTEADRVDANIAHPPQLGERVVQIRHRDEAHRDKASGCRRAPFLDTAIDRRAGRDERFIGALCATATKVPPATPGIVGK